MSWISRTLIVVALAAVAAGGLAYVRYGVDIARARDAAASGGAVADTAAGPIEYAERGTGIPLLSIHGAGGGYDQGLANVADLVGSDFRVIAPSRFGYLGTPIPADVSSAAQADAHAALLASLDVDRAVVVGVSAGARSAVEFAIRHPDAVSALILIVPGTYSPTSPVAIESSRGSQFVFWLVNAGADFIWWAMEKSTPSMLVRFLGVRPEVVAAAPPAEQERVERIVHSVQPLSQRFPGINIDSNSDTRPPAYGAIHAPTLVISARDDQFNTLPAAEYAATSIPGARLIVYDTGGHLLVGHEADARTVVGEFLAGAGVMAETGPVGALHP